MRWSGSRPRGPTIGLPTDAIPLAPFAFDVGIGLGPLAFVGFLLALGAMRTMRTTTA